MPLLKSESITALYGAEPCTALHSVLRAKAEQEGISHKYHILPTGVAKSDLLPALAKSGMELAAYEKDPGVGVFDTILCVRVLCSVPEMEKTVGELYGLLKPGGRLLVTEHVVNSWRKAKGSFAARAAQWVYGALGWSWFIGDCALDRDTESVLRGAAGAEGWESVELERNFEWSAMPYLSGVLTKKG
jgi:SAM-dependent methyltransferase